MNRRPRLLTLAALALTVAAATGCTAAERDDTEPASDPTAVTTLTEPAARPADASTPEPRDLSRQLEQQGRDTGRQAEQQGRETGEQWRDHGESLRR
ncbi:hypothetical protein ACIRPK_17055 [Kitasatospora sp. NPDC101801]|uniref:hypothetical protein n=1 Tax=Kitasatospora sp. NPDC101801 TaxID=3364103 RepID=UPI00380288F3